MINNDKCLKKKKKTFLTIRTECKASIKNYFWGFYNYSKMFLSSIVWMSHRNDENKVFF